VPWSRPSLLLYALSWYGRYCGLISIQSMDPFRTGKLVLFQVSYDRDWHYFEIPAYIIIGIFGVGSFHRRTGGADLVRDFTGHL